MTENAVIIKGRLLNKHDTEANWSKATNFAPLLGETIVYDPDSAHPYPRYKVGIWDGKSTKTVDMLIMNLPFANQPDTIGDDDFAALFSTQSTRTVTEYTHFDMHLINTQSNTLTVASIQYAPGITTWENLVNYYPEYFSFSSTDWDKVTGKPYICFASPFNGEDYVMKRVTPVNPEDPVSVPCVATDLVNPDILRVTYKCTGEGCPICAEYSK